MVDSMMIGKNFDNIDPQSNFTGPNVLAEMAEANKLVADFKVVPPVATPLTDAVSARKRAESVSRKYARAQYALERAIHDLKGAGFNTVELEANLDEVRLNRTVARIARAQARVNESQTALAVLEQAATKYVNEEGDLEQGDN